MGVSAAGDKARLCLDCAALGACATQGHRHVAHPELAALAIAHIDCDAFYASVEKIGRPELASRPVIVGGGRRGVVTTACYVARIHGVRSAMPMFRALQLCPDAHIIRPDFPRYTEIAHRLRALMLTLTPLVQVLSIDEAVLDLSGTERLHGAPPCVMLARLAQQVESRIGITVSIGLASNRLLAKLAAERAKPRGFSVLGSEAAEWLKGQEVGLLPGIGPAATSRLASRGIARLGQLQALSPKAAAALLGPDGPALVRRAAGCDDRKVQTGHETRSVSAETTFDRDLTSVAELEARLWQVCEKLGARLREKQLAAGGVTLKLKTTRFASRTRAARLANPTALPDTLFEAARSLLAKEADGTAFRLIGIGASPVLPGQAADLGDLADADAPRRVARQQALDSLRARFGPAAIGRGRGLSAGPKRQR